MVGHWVLAQSDNTEKSRVKQPIKNNRRASSSMQTDWYQTTNWFSGYILYNNSYQNLGFFLIFVFSSKVTLPWNVIYERIEDWKKTKKKYTEYCQGVTKYFMTQQGWKWDLYTTGREKTYFINKDKKFLKRNRSRGVPSPQFFTLLP